jgi:hypothetical protein
LKKSRIEYRRWDIRLRIQFPNLFTTKRQGLEKT